MPLGDARLPELFWSKVEAPRSPESCWLWTKCSNGHGLTGSNVMPRKESGRRRRKCWSERGKANRAASRSVD